MSPVPDETDGRAARWRRPRATITSLAAASLIALGCAPANERAAAHAGISPPAPPALMAAESPLPTQRPVVIVVTAAWCASCRATAPAIAWLRTEYGDRVSFVDLDLSDDATTARSSVEAVRLGLRAFLEANEGRTGVTILGYERKIIRRSMIERRSGPYRAAFEEAFASFLAP
jgi:thiol-disulfide isomerase/thioredoxin